MEDREDLQGVEVNVGDSVCVIGEQVLYRMNTNERHTLTPGTELLVTRVYRQSLIVRTAQTVQTPGYSGTWEHVSFQIDRMFLRMFDPSRRARRLGEKPEDTDEIQHIDIDHPGIQWLFTDMGHYADQQGYCSQYDMLCARLGIPGRERDFTVKTTLQGIELSTVIKARSQREANEKVHKLLHPESLAIAA